MDSQSSNSTKPEPEIVKVPPCQDNEEIDQFIGFALEQHRKHFGSDKHVTIDTLAEAVREWLLSPLTPGGPSAEKRGPIGPIF